MSLLITAEAARAALREADPQAMALDVLPLERVESTGPSVGQRRRMRRAGEADPVAVMTLTLNEEGVLLWHEGLRGPHLPGRRRRRGVPLSPEGEVVDLYQFERLPPNRVGAFLTDLDKQLNGEQGLKQWDGQTWSRPDQLPSGRKRRLLLVHGTFSKTEAMLTGIASAPNGAAFLSSLSKRYDEVLAFDHPSLSVSPVMNAFDLARLLARVEGPLDIVAHSRGGLVTRWLFEGFGLQASPCRAVLVGSPLGGTSLASPARLRDALSLLSNIGTALRGAGTVATIYLPFLSVPLALLRVATSAVSFVAKTPILDATVAMIPGLAGQSRVGGNPELERIRAVRLNKPPAYFVVQTNFEPEEAGWRFWRWFRRDKWADLGADRLFPGPNDLVVDTVSMTDVSKIAFPAKRLKDFGTSAVVHHTNYFAQAETLDFITEKLDSG